jgi:hypothetical protein
MLTLVTDLLLTDAFLIKGKVQDKYTRLSQVLDEHRKFFLKVRDATLIDLKTRERIQTPLLHVNVDEILLAHELLDESGDEYLRALSQDEELHKVRVFYTGEQNLEVAGKVRPGCYEATDRATRRFFVVREPELRGLKTEGDEDLGLLDGLSYAILNKPRLSYLYDFN